MEPTKMPWVVEGSHLWRRDEELWGHNCVASFGDGDDQSREDAAFAGRACNAHNAMVAALVHVRRSTERGAVKGNLDMTMIDAALALAEGGGV